MRENSGTSKPSTSITNAKVVALVAIALEALAAFPTIVASGSSSVKKLSKNIPTAKSRALNRDQIKELIDPSILLGSGAKVFLGGQSLDSALDHLLESIDQKAIDGDNMVYVDEKFVANLMNILLKGNQKEKDFDLGKAPKTENHEMRKFSEAILQNDLSTISEILEKGFDVNSAINVNNQHPLSYAVEKGKFEVVKFLIKRGANVDSAIQVGSVRIRNLLMAIENRHKKIVKALIEAGAELNSLAIEGDIEASANYNYLDFAIAKGDMDIIQALIDGGADVNMELKSRGTPLIAAIAKGSMDIIQALIEAGADVNKAETESGDTPLIIAINKGDLAAVKMLIKSGANVNKTETQFEVIPLFSAINHGHLEIAKALIEAGADVNAVVKSGNTALIFAINKDHMEIAEALIKAGADVNKAETEFGVTPLIASIDRGQIGIAKALIVAGADVNATANSGKTVLYHAKLIRNQNFIDLLTSNGARDEEPSGQSYTKYAIAAGTTLIGAAGFSAANYLANQNKKEQERISEQQKKLSDERRQKNQEEAEKQVLEQLNQAVSALSELPARSFQNLDLVNRQKEKGESVLIWQKDPENNRFTLRLQFAVHRFNDEIKAIFTQIKTENGSKFFALNADRSLIYLDLVPNSTNSPLQQNGENFTIKTEFFEVLQQITKNLVEPISDEKQRVEDALKLEEEKARDEKEKSAHQKKISGEKTYLNDLQQKSVSAKKYEEKQRLQSLIDRQQQVIKTLDATEAARIEAQKLEEQKLAKIQQQNQQAALQKAQRREERRQGQAMEEEFAQELQAEGQMQDLNIQPQQQNQIIEQPQEVQAATPPKQNSTPNSSPRSSEASPASAAKAQIDIAFWEEMLLGIRRLEPIRIEVDEGLDPAKIHSNFLINNRQQLREKFQNYQAQYRQSGTVENAQNLKNAKTRFHDLLDLAVDRVAEEGSDSASKSQIRDRLYFLLNYCAGDEEACKNSFILTENEGRQRGARTGLGHASGNSQENLFALTQILGEFIDSKQEISQAAQGSGSPKLALKNTTSQDLLGFQRKYWISISDNSSKKAMVIRRSEEKDDFAMTQFLVENLEDPRFADFKEAASKAIEEFIYLNSLAGLKEAGEKSVSREKVAEFLEEEKNNGYQQLRQIVIFAKKFGEEELKDLSKTDDSASKRAASKVGLESEIISDFEKAKSLGAMSFEQFKQNLEAIYQGRFEQTKRANQPKKMGGFVGLGL